MAHTSVTGNFNRGNSIQEEFITAKNEYDEVTKKLVAHIKSKLEHSIDESLERKIISDFSEYLLDRSVFNDYKGLISHFLLSNQDDAQFVKKLNQIEEGLILYAGIKYSPDLSSLGKWSGNLVVYLDIEHLFSATGLNGVLYKKIFDDFNSLVKEVNLNKKKGGSITLRYFEETLTEVESFFYAAERIVEGHQPIDPSKTAMIDITNGCSTRSQVVVKKSAFFENLKKLKITAEEKINYYDNPEFNVESADTIDLLKRTLNHNNESERYSEILRLFTKINFYRNGKNDVGIEYVSAIFLSESGLTRAVSFSDIVHKGGIPFSTNIEFLTERIWFKLNKGFGKGLPLSFDVITKAKLVLSSQVNNAVSETYKDIRKEFDNGEINENQVATMLSDLRSRSSSNREDFTSEHLDSSIKFLDQNFIEHSLRERTFLEKKAKAGEVAIEQVKLLETALEEQSKVGGVAAAELKMMKRKQYIVPLKREAKLLHLLLKIFFYLAIPVFIFFILWELCSPSDSWLSIVFGVAGILSLIIAGIKFSNRQIRLRFMWYCRKRLSKIRKRA